MTIWDLRMANKEEAADMLSVHYDKNEDVWDVMRETESDDRVIDFFLDFITDNDLVKRFELDADRRFNLKRQYINRRMEEGE